MKYDIYHDNPYRLRNAGSRKQPRRQAQVGSSALVEAVEAMKQSILNLRNRIGCGCGGDYGLCTECEAADAQAEIALEMMAKAKASTAKVSSEAKPRRAPPTG